MVTLKKAFEKYETDNVKDLFFYPYMKYDNEKPEILYYTLCLMALYISVDSDILADYNAFVKEFDIEMSKFWEEAKQQEKQNNESKQQLEFSFENNLKLH